MAEAVALPPGSVACTVLIHRTPHRFPRAMARRPCPRGPWGAPPALGPRRAGCSCSVQAHSDELGPMDGVGSGSTGLHQMRMLHCYGVR